MASSVLLRSTKIMRVIPLGILARNVMTSSDINTALRPFYFLVHPDLFGRFPKEQAVNQKSIQTLKSYLEDCSKSRMTPTRSVRKVMFYLRPATSLNESEYKDRSRLRCVTIALDSTDVRRVILKVLKEANLPTSVVESLSSHHQSTDQKPHPVFYEGSADEPLIVHTKKGKMDVAHPLDVWLTDNIEEARRMMEKVEPVVLKATRIKDEICNEFELRDITWMSEWQRYTRINKLEGLRTLLRNHEGVHDLLRHRKVIFSDGRSGITLNGSLCLYGGEVTENWLGHIRRIPQAENRRRLIPDMESDLSEALGRIKIVRRSHVITLAEEYLGDLKQILDAVWKYQRSNDSYPENWPGSLADLELCVEVGGTPLMISPSGQIIVPSNASVKYLLPFICDNLNEAREKLLLAKELETGMFWQLQKAQ